MHDRTTAVHALRTPGFAEHGVAGPDGKMYEFACMKFDVLMTNPDDTNYIKNYLICRELSISQNQETLVTELRISQDTRVFGLRVATVERSPEGNSRVIKAYLLQSEDYAQSLPWTIEFASHYKMFQFMQLRQLFKIRYACKLKSQLSFSEASK